MTPNLELFQNQSLAAPLKIILLLSLLALLPAVILTSTSFVRTVVVLSFVRQGVGAQQMPPNQVVIGLALFISFFTMAPVLDEMKKAAWDPYQRGEMSDFQAVETGVLPLKRFMLRQTREKDLRLFYSVTDAPLPESPDDVRISIAMPAFVISELTTAFQMGVMVLLPFLVVDVVVASLLMSMGMMMVPPSTISLPIKLLLFVLVDGWNLVAGSLLRSFA